MADPKPIDDLLEPGPIDDLLESAGQTLGSEATATPAKKWESVQDAANMVPAGASAGHDDEVAGLVAGIGAMLGKPLQNPRQTFSPAYQQARDERQASKTESMRRSPRAGGAGYVGGALASGQALIRAGAAIPGVIGKAVQMAGGGAKAAEGAGLAARVGTAVGNLAVPGAIAGAGEAQSLSDVPGEALEGAVLSTAAGSAMSGVGRALRAIPGAREWAQRGGDKAFLQSTGTEGAVLKHIAKEPGGLRERVAAMERLGIGKGLWPRPAKAAEQAETAVDVLNKDRQALVDAAGPDVRIPSEQNAQYMREAARRDFPAEVADSTIRDRINAEAAKQAEAGRMGYDTVSGRRPVQPPVQPRAYESPPVEARAVDVTGQRAAVDNVRGTSVVDEGAPQLQASSPLVPPAPRMGFEGEDLAQRYFARAQTQTPAQRGGPLARTDEVIQGELEPPAGAPPAPQGTSLQRYSHTSPLVAGDEYTERIATGPYRTLQQQQDEISAYNRRGLDAQKARAGEDAAVNRTLGRAVNDSAEYTLNKISPGLGTAWRGNKFDTNVAIKAHDSAVETAAKPMIMRSAGRGIARAATMFGTSTGNIPVAAAGVVADVAMTPQLQMHAYRGIQRVAEAANRAGNTAIGRALAKMPGAQVGARSAQAVNAGMQEVQRAALKSQDEFNKTHYLQSETNPDYREAVTKPEN